MELTRSMRELVEKTKRNQKVSIAELFRELGITAPADLMTDKIDIIVQTNGWTATAKLANEPGWTVSLIPSMRARFFDLSLEASRIAGESSATFEGTMDLGRSVLLHMKYEMPGDVAFTGSFGLVSTLDLLELFGAGDIDALRLFAFTIKESAVTLERSEGEYRLGGTAKTDVGDFEFRIGHHGGKWRCAFIGKLTLDPTVFFGFLHELRDYMKIEEPSLTVTTYNEPFLTVRGKFNRRLPELLRWWPVLLDFVGISVDDRKPVEIEVYAKLDRCKAKIPFTASSYGLEGTLGFDYKTGGAPTVFVEGTLSTSIGTFDVAGRREAFGFVISSSMTNKTVSIPGFGTLRNLGLTLGINVNGIPSFGFAGTFDSASFELSVAFFANSTDPAKSMVVAAMDSVSLNDVLTAIAKVPRVPVLSDILERFAVRPSKSFQFGPELAPLLDARDSDKCDDILNTHKIGDKDLDIVGTSELRIFVNQPGSRWHFTRLASRDKLLHYSAKKNDGGVLVELMGQLYFAPEDTSIGKIEFKQGMWVKARVELFNLRGFIDAEVIKEKGIRAQVRLDPVVVGSGDFIKLTDATDPSAGPSLSIATFEDPAEREAKTRGPHAYVSGALRILGANFASAQLEANHDGAKLIVGASIPKVANLSPSIDVNLTAPINSDQRATIDGTASFSINTLVLDIGTFSQVGIGVTISGSLQRGTTVVARFRVPVIPTSFSTPAIPLTVPLGDLDKFLLSHLQDAITAGLALDAWLDLVKKGLVILPGAKEIANAVIKHFGKSVTQAAKTLKRLGNAAGNVANAFKELGSDPRESLKSLLEAGYNVADAAAAVKDSFAATPELIVDVATSVYGGVKNISEKAVGEITGALQSVYNLDGAAIGRKLKNAGYEVAQIATTLHNTLKWSAEKTADFLKNGLNVAKSGVEAALNAAGYAANEIRSALGKLWEILDPTRW